MDWRERVDNRKRRTHVYIERPIKFQIPGCVCGNNDPDWSEYAGYLWCAKCKTDFVPEHWGILDGPVSVECCELMGIYFDFMDLATGKIEAGPSGIVHFKENGQ